MKEEKAEEERKCAVSSYVSSPKQITCRTQRASRLSARTRSSYKEDKPSTKISGRFIAFFLDYAEDGSSNDSRLPIIICGHADSSRLSIIICDHADR